MQQMSKMEIAIISHDGKKAEMVQFLNEHKAILESKSIHLIATGTTGSKAIKAGFDVWVDFDYPLIHNNPNILK